MSYTELVRKIAVFSGCMPETVKDVLDAMPTALASLKEGDQVHTPLGKFEAVRRKGRWVDLPDRSKKAKVFEKITVKLRPNDRMKRLPH